MEIRDYWFKNMKNLRTVLSLRVWLALSVVTLALGLSALPLDAATYYVRKDGRDSNAGTANTSGGAWLTVQKAANTMVAGDAVTVVTGDYNETVTETTSGSNGSPITFLASGTVTINRFVCSGAYVVVDGINVDGPDAASNGTGGMIDLAPTADKCQFKNMRLTGVAASYADGLGAISMDFPGPDDCVFTNLTIVDANYTIVEFYGKRNLFVNSTITGNAGWDVFRVIYSEDNIIRGTVINARSDYGAFVVRHPDFIQAFNDEGLPIQRLLVENNTWIGAGSGDDTQLGNITDDGNVGLLQDWTFRNNVFINIPRTMNLYAPNFKFYNNTFYRCGVDSGWIVIGGSSGAGSASGLVFTNNILFECGSGSNPYNGWYISDLPVAADYNLVIGTGAGTTKSGFSEPHGLNGVNPLFVNAAVNDFRLQAGSPAINAGVNLSSRFTTDMNGVMRGSTWDMGANEFAAGATNQPSVSLIATPPAITSGQSSTLTWTSVNVTNVTISSLGSVALNGSVNVTPSTTTSYTLTAAGPGGTATSSATVTVNLPTPAIVLTAPLNGTNYPTAPATVALSASVTANGTSITKVQFYNGAALLGEAVSSPYNFTWSNVTKGSFSLVARVVYGAGSTLDSTPVNISVGTPNSLVAAYSFDEGTGATVTDASGNGNTGAISGATWSTGKYGNALTFNGTTALVTIPDSAALDLSTGMTLEAWVNPTVVSSAWRDVIYKGDEYYFLEATSTQGQVPCAGGTLGNTGIQATYGTAALVPNTWTHLAATYDGTTLRLYVNGVQVSSAAVTGNIPTSAYPLQIGGDNLHGQFFAGQIDDVRVYNVARTPAQIQSDMNTRITVLPASGVPTPPGNLSISVGP